MAGASRSYSPLASSAVSSSSSPPSPGGGGSPSSSPSVSSQVHSSTGSWYRTWNGAYHH